MPYCKKCGNELPEGAQFCPVCGTPVTMEAAPAPVTAAPSQTSGLKLALWGERFLAWLIDVVIIGVVVGILGLFSLLAGVTWWSGWPGWLPFFNFNLGGVLYFLYWMFMEGSYGQSFGKMIMRIKITRFGKRGKSVSASVGLPVRLAYLSKKETENFQLHLGNNSDKRNLTALHQRRGHGFRIK